MQNWLKQRLQFLKTKYDSNTFTFEDLERDLREKFEDSDKMILKMLSALKKLKLIETTEDEKDSRRKIYRVIDPQDNLLEEIKEKKTLDRKDLETLLKDAADLIRTKVDYSFILLLLFYKKVSDKWHKEYELAFKESREVYHLSDDEAKVNAEDPTYHDFVIPEDYLWENIRKKPEQLAENFSRAMKALAERNPTYKDVFENFDFSQFVGNVENQEILYQLVELFSITSLDNASPDVMGDAYEWLIRMFAPQKAKEGEVYTAREIIKLLVSLLDPKPGESVYDPSLGSAGMLIAAHNYVREKYGDEEAKRLFMYGQEVNYKTRSIAKMNLYLHGIKNGIPEYGDTLLYPKFKENSELMKFDVTLANPPWNLDGYGEDTIKKGEFWKERFNEFGFAPDQSADWMWIAHMWASVKENTGRVGIVIDNGALFRGGKEKAIRTKFVTQDLIDTIILLPEKLFYNTSSSAAVLILNKNKRIERKGKIQFINATNEFIKHPEVRRLHSLSNDNIMKVVNAYLNNEIIEGFCKFVTYNEMLENDFNLNVSLYVYQSNINEEINLKKEIVKVENIHFEIDELIKNLKNSITEIN